MASNHRASRVNFATPVGKAQYPHLNKPDGKFEDPPKFKTSIILSKAEAKEMIANMREIAKESLGDKIDRARYPYAVDSDTGEVVLKVKTKLAPQFTDTTGALIADSSKPYISGGSRLRLFGTFFTYDTGANCGVSAQLDAIQIVDLSSGSGHQIGAVEGGSFVAGSAPVQESVNDQAEDDYDF